MDADQLHAELAAEQVALRWSATWTTLTAIGLATGLVAGWAGADAVVPYAYALAFLAGGVPAGLDALRELVRGKLDIDLLMVLAALAAAAVGAPRDGAILLFLFSLAGTLEERAMGTTRRAVAALMQLRPDTAHLLEGEGGDERERDVRAEDVAVGARVRVRPGERIPLDGTVQAGMSAVDQAPITGESLPVDKGVGDEVFAGTVNGHGSLVVRVTKAASDSTLARMVKLVTEAQAAKAPSERFSDWFGQRYTIFVLAGTAAALALFLVFGLPASEAFYRAATLLVVASPCAVVISVPAAILSALAAAARRGVLFKGGGALEALAEIDGIAFDKTGTLTRGVMRVVETVPLAVDDAELLGVAAALEEASEHPIARAVVAYAKERGVAPAATAHVTARPGHGVSGEVNGYHAWAGNRRMAAAEGLDLDDIGHAREALVALERAGRTVVVVADRGAHGTRLLGLLAVADTPRPHAAAALADLRAAGVPRLAVLTGDHAAVAHAVAAELEIPVDAVRADLLPEHKVDEVRAFAKGGRVAFVGDGVNDAAALATADVGIAMGAAGSDVALETAEVALLSDDLRRLAESVRLARATRTVIRQNLGFALGVMAIMVVATVVGRLPLPLGVVGHEGGTLLVVANGLRLLGRGRAPA